MSILGAMFTSLASSAISKAISTKNSALGSEVGKFGSTLGSSMLESTFRSQEEKRKQNFLLEQWNRQNAYNLPSAQRQRLEQAGLNPALMYAGGNVGNTAAELSSAPSSGFRGGDQLDLLAAQQAGAQIRKTNAEAELLESQKRKVEGETLEPGTQQRYQEALTNLLDNRSITEKARAEAIQFDNLMNKKFTSDEREMALKLRKESLDNLIADTIGKMNENSLFEFRRAGVINDLYLQVQRYNLMCAEEALQRVSASISHQNLIKLQAELPYLVAQTMMDLDLKVVGYNQGINNIVLQQKAIEKFTFSNSVQAFNFWSSQANQWVNTIERGVAIGMSRGFSEIGGIGRSSQPAVFSQPSSTYY